MKKIHFFLAIFILLFLLSSYGQTVKVLDYNITFVGMTPDYANNTSTWNYTVSTVGSAKDLSHWIVELCVGQKVKNANPSPWEVPSNGDPTTQVYGIKWDKQQNVGQTQNYSFTLEGIYQIAQVKVGVKTGGKVKVGVGYISGPSCDIDIPKSKIGNRVWLDENKNGIQDADEKGVENVNVKLYKCDDTFIKSTTTNIDGFYIFDNLTPDDYYVQFIIPDGYNVSPKNIGDNREKDSDADPITGKTICTTLEPNEIDTTWDMGIYTQTNPCVTSFSVNWIGQNTICEYEAKFIKVYANIELTANPSKALVKYYYKQINQQPENPQYTILEIVESRLIEIEGYWPGIKPDDTSIALEFGLEIYDCDGNKIGETSNYTVYWDHSICPPPQPEKPDLLIEKFSDKTLVENGNSIDFTVKVTNLGPGDASNIIVSDFLSNGLIFQTSSTTAYNPTTGIWSIPTLLESQSVELSVNTLVNTSNMLTSTFDLGPAKGFNVFVFEDFNQNNGDTEGKMAIGGNASLSGYSVGDKLPVTFSGDALIVGGNLNYTSGRVFYGNIVFGKTTNLPLGSVTVNGSIRQENVIDFKNAESYLKSLSIQLKNMTTNGNSILEWTTVKLTGTDPIINVFDVDGTMFSNANGTVIDVPNGSVVLVNISGKSIDWYGGLDINGTAYNNVLYNFYEAENLIITSMETRGTVLAPFADFLQRGGFLNGQLICKSVLDATQFNNNLFVGNIQGATEIVNIATILSFDQTDDNLTNNTAHIALKVNSSIPANSLTNYEGNWIPQGSLNTNELIWSFAKDKDNKQLLGSWGGNIYRLENTSYVLINSGMGVNYIWSLILDSQGNIYAGTEKGIFLSTDNGTTWGNTNFKIQGVYPEVRTITFDKNGILYAGTWGNGVYKFAENNWISINDDLASVSIQSLIVDSQNNIYAGSYDNGLFILKNNSTKWIKSSLVYEYIWCLAINSDDIMFAGTYGGGVFISYDAGENWIQQITGLPSYYIYNIQLDNNDIYVSAWASGVYKMQLYGGESLSKKSLNKSNNTLNIGWKGYGLSGYNVSSLFVNDATNELYAGTQKGELFKFESSAVSIKDNNIPDKFTLEQNYPNPFNPTTKIPFSVSKQGIYKLEIINILGQVVEILINKSLNIGNHIIEFNANTYSSGVYFYRLIGDNVNITRKMLIVK